MEPSDNDQMIPIDENPTDDPGPAVPSDAPDDVALVRDFIVATDPGLIPELVMGASVGEVLASVAAARAAYRRVAEQVRAGQVADGAAGRFTPSGPMAPVVPAGGAAAFVVDPGELPSGELIRRGISAARRVSG